MKTCPSYHQYAEYLLECPTCEYERQRKQRREEEEEAARRRRADEDSADSGLALGLSITASIGSTDSSSSFSGGGGDFGGGGASGEF